MFKLLVFAGTTEGRELVERLQGKPLEVHASVATKYGQMLLPGENTHVGRLTGDAIEDFLRENAFDGVVDATHPYAALVSENIKNACLRQNKPCLRLLREKSYDDLCETLKYGDCICVNNTEEAAAFLKTTEGRVLLTTGSKELAKYADIPEFEERFFARVLPTPEVVAACNSLGLRGKHLICMQGPFDYEMNAAMLRWLGCKYMVTKDSGKVGGGEEKLAAARAAGVKLVIIGRPSEENGMSMSRVLAELEALSGSCLGDLHSQNDQNFDLPQAAREPECAFAANLDLGSQTEPKGESKGSEFQLTKTGRPSYFPLFTDISRKKILIVGGGNIAFRRIKTLMQFNTWLKIVAIKIKPELMALLEENSGSRGGLGQIELIQRPFEEADLLDADIVITATNHRAINNKIGCLCKKQGIIVNVADAKEECGFFFPGIAISGDLVAGVSAQGNSHSLAKEAAKMIRRELECLREK